ncbi:MAG: dihydrofolate reductase [Synechococcus sp.]
MNSPEIIAIAALTEGDRVIGKNGKVPWHIPADLQRFKQITWGHTVIVGRKTWEFDLENCPLPGRHTIVVSKTPDGDRRSETCKTERYQLTFAKSLTAALSAADNCDRIFIIGGGTLYQQALPITDILELTIVESSHTGDTFFPAYEHLIGKEFQLLRSEQHEGYRYETYRRI